MMMARIAGVVAAALMLPLALTACVGHAVRSTEGWLAEQPHVVSVGVPDSTVDELSYTATLRAELDPAATDAQIEKLIDDSIDFVDGSSDVSLQFGMHGIDFEVADKSEARTALALWRKVVDLPDIVNGFVAPDAVSASTLRSTAFSVFDALAPLGVSRSVNAYHAQTDFDVNSADFLPPIVLSGECEPDPTVLGLAQAAMTDSRVDFAALDLCTGLDVTFANGYDLADGVTKVRQQLDAAGLDDFPVNIGVAPAQYGSADFHIVAVTPGSPDALAVVAGLEASPVALRYELSADRTLSLESSDSTTAELLAVLPAEAASLGQITITGSDTTITGTYAQLHAQ